MRMATAILTATATITTTATIDYNSCVESNGMITAIIYLLFIFDENVRENLLATKGMGGGRGIVG